jgi:hypothetical protein
MLWILAETATYKAALPTCSKRPLEISRRDEGRAARFRAVDWFRCGPLFKLEFVLHNEICGEESSCGADRTGSLVAAYEDLAI